MGYRPRSLPGIARFVDGNLIDDLAILGPGAIAQSIQAGVNVDGLIG